ncbi:MAG: DNA-binding response regulator [Dehalococcoidia bacterium]|nr:MAG: DNA-binding response regulator [Dehalococcoidia bacterium]
MKHFSILVADDDERILNFLCVRLKSAGYEVCTAANGIQAVDHVRSKNPDLVILDLMMPQMDGLEAMREIRTFATTPVIMLTARGEDDEKIRGLKLGADDYLAKPFNPDELVARIEAVRRRIEPQDKRKTLDIFIHGDVKVDFKQHVVTVAGEEKYLTRIEWLLLTELVQSAGRFMTYEEMLSRVWGSEYQGDVQLLRTWISRLRCKLEKNPGSPQLIRTIPKSGYIIHHDTTVASE